jgi:hypothetical protein
MKDEVWVYVDGQGNFKVEKGTQWYDPEKLKIYWPELYKKVKMAKRPSSFKINKKLLEKKFVMEEV